MANRINGANQSNGAIKKVLSPDEELRQLEEQLVKNLPNVQAKDKAAYMERLDTVSALRKNAGDHRDSAPVQVAVQAQAITSQAPVLKRGEHFASYNAFEPSLITHLQANKKSLLDNFAKA